MAHDFGQQEAALWASEQGGDGPEECTRRTLWQAGYHGLMKVLGGLLWGLIKQGRRDQHIESSAHHPPWWHVGARCVGNLLVVVILMFSKAPWMGTDQNPPVQKYPTTLCWRKRSSMFHHCEEYSSCSCQCIWCSKAGDGIWTKNRWHIIPYLSRQPLGWTTLNLCILTMASNPTTFPN